MRRYLVSATLLMTTLSAAGQWKIQDAHTTASLRGIHSLGNGIAWASGTGGTVLRTKDGGTTWEHCATPPDAEKLDFRGVQAFDAKTAIVMSSGKGDLSRLYKTIDGCKTWNLELQNDKPEGFWDALRMWTPVSGFLLGDPVDGEFDVHESLLPNGFWDDSSYDFKLRPGFVSEAAFAASNSSIALGPFSDESGATREMWFASGGKSGSVIRHQTHHLGGEPETLSLSVTPVPSFPQAESAGIFSIYLRTTKIGVAVGGDYQKANDSSGTAAFTTDGDHWLPSKGLPHGYRSAVAYDPKTKIWITVGTNGTDISTDDGANWNAIRPGPNDASDADKNWNALSVPFVVGPHGRIGVLRPDALKAPK